MSYETIYLGPLGRLTAIMVPSGGYDADPIEFGGLHEPLSGVATKDIFGHRRRYNIGLDGLDPRALSWLEMLFYGAVEQPHYIRDTRRANLLKPRVSTSMSYPFDPSSSTPTYVNPGGGVLTPVAASTPYLPVAGVLSPGPTRAVQWAPAAANVLTDAVLTPVLPGETVIFSCYVQAGAPTLEIVPYNAALAPQTAITGTTVVAGTPPRRWVSYTVPSNGTIVAVAPQIRASAAGTFTTYAWMLSTSLSDWVMGTGCPKVIFDTFPQHRERLGKYTSATATLREA